MMATTVSNYSFSSGKTRKGFAERSVRERSFGNVAGERGMGATVRLVPDPNGTTVQGHRVQWPVVTYERQGGLCLHV